jgi:integrase
VKGVKEQVVDGETSAITIDQARALLKSIRLNHKVKLRGKEPEEVVSVIGLGDRAILATLAYTACRAGAVAKPRLGDFEHDGTQYVLRFQEKGGKSREIPVRHDLEGCIRAYLDAAGILGDNKDRLLFRSNAGRTKQLTA